MSTFPSFYATATVVPTLYASVADHAQSGEKRNICFCCKFIITILLILLNSVTDIVIYFLSVNGGWGEWGRWSECSAACGPGMRSRERKCDSPKPANDGAPCNKTEKVEVERCKKQNCPGSQTIFFSCNVSLQDKGDSRNKGIETQPK